FDDLVEITDAALSNGSCERPVDPHRVAALEEVATNEISSRQVVMAGDGDERPLELVGHCLDEARLSAPRRALQQDRESLTERGAEHLLLIANRDVVGARGVGHALLLSIRRRSRVRSLLWNVRR